MTRRPSPTTVEYTVSTSPSLTLSLRALLLLTFAGRILVGAGIALLLYARLALSIPPPTFATRPAFFTDDYIHYLLACLLASPTGTLASSLSALIPLPVLLPSAFILLYALLLRVHTTESLLILRGLGIQTSTSAKTFLGSATTRFIPTAKIQDILVNEAFRGFEVRYYLVVVVEGEGQVVVVFPRLLPGRKIVERVWRGSRRCLWEMDEKEKGREREGGK
jgi:phosphatidylinositol glycan class H protein